MQYRIGNPLQFMFELRDPAATLHETSETAVRELAAGDELQSLLNGAARARLGSAARDRIQQALNRYAAGIDVTGVSLTDVALPDPVIAAQHDAQRAAEDRQHTLNDAQTYATQTDVKAQAAAQSQLSEAQVYATQVVASAQGDAERFTQLANAYALSPQVTRDRLYIDTIGSILAHSRKIFIDAKSGNSTVIYLPLDKLIEAAHSGAPAAAANTPPAAAASAAAAAVPAAPQSNSDAVLNDRQGNNYRSRERADR